MNLALKGCMVVGAILVPLVELLIVLLFADDAVSFSPASLTIIGILISSLVGAVVFLFKLYDRNRDAQLAELKEQRDSFKKVADRAVSTLEAEAERRMIARGEVPIPKIIQSEPEHNSPTTERQKFSSDMESLKARQAAAALAIELARTGDAMVTIPMSAVTGVKVEDKRAVKPDGSVSIADVTGIEMGEKDTLPPHRPVEFPK